MTMISVIKQICYMIIVYSKFYEFSFATRIEQNITHCTILHIYVYSSYSNERLKVFLYEEKTVYSNYYNQLLL